MFSLFVFFYHISLLAHPTFDFAGVYSATGGPSGPFTLVPDGAYGCGSWVSGAAWSTTTLDFTKDFIIEYELEVAPMYNPVPANRKSPSGADGYVVVFGSNLTPTSLNSAAAGLGYYNLPGTSFPNPDFDNSIGIEFDIHNNDAAWNDIHSDHIIATAEGDPFNVQQNLGYGYNPRPIHPNSGVIDYNQYVKYKIEWHCELEQMWVYYNGNLRLKVSISSTYQSYQFTDWTNVSWGVTAARGGDCSEFRFKNFVVQYDEQCDECFDGYIDVYLGGCQNNTFPNPPSYMVGITGLVPNAMPADITKFEWDFGDGSPILVENYPLQNGMSWVHDYFYPGTYIITLTIYGLEEQQIPCKSVVKAIINVPDCSMIVSDDDGDYDPDGGSTGSPKPGRTTAVGSIAEDNSALSVYPNPVNNMLHIDNTTTKLSGVIYDITGAAVISFNIDDSNNKINVENLSSGIYILKLIDEQGVIKQQKLIVE